MDIRTLIQEALGGNTRAFDELYACSRQSVWFTCIQLLKNEQDAQDLMQDTYLTAFSKLDTLENPDAFIGWINRIAINKCKNFLRKNSAYTYDEMQNYADMPEVNEEFLPEEYVTNESRRKILLDIMQKSLSEVQYQTIILHYFDELSVAEIAELMECGEEAVKSRLRYARAKIKEEVLRYEKQNNDRLFVFVPVVYLSNIFWSEANSSETPLINYAAQNLVQNSIITQEVAGQVKAAATTGGKAMLKAGKAKLIAGIAAGAIVVGGTIALVKFSGKDHDGEKTEVTTNEQTTTDNMVVSGETSGNASEQSDDGTSGEENVGFRMKIDDIFNLTDGVKIIGTIESGTVRINDQVELIKDGKAVLGTVIEMDILGETVEQASADEYANEYVVIKVAHIKRSDVEVGGYVTSPSQETLAAAAALEEENASVLHPPKDEEALKDPNFSYEINTAKGEYIETKFCTIDNVEYVIGSEFGNNKICVEKAEYESNQLAGIKATLTNTSDVSYYPDKTVCTVWSYDTGSYSLGGPYRGTTYVVKDGDLLKNVEVAPGETVEIYILGEINYGWHQRFADKIFVTFGMEENFGDLKYTLEEIYSSGDTYATENACGYTFTVRDFDK